MLWARMATSACFTDSARPCTGAASDHRATQLCPHALDRLQPIAQLANTYVSPNSRPPHDHTHCVIASNLDLTQTLRQQHPSPRLAAQPHGDTQHWHNGITDALVPHLSLPPWCMPARIADKPPPPQSARPSSYCQPAAFLWLLAANNHKKSTTDPHARRVKLTHP
jgi:hypothetical protein